MALFHDIAAALNQFASGHIYLALIILLAVEEAGLPLPISGDVLITYAGSQIVTGATNPLLALPCIIIGVYSGSSLLYLLARKGGLPLLQRYGWLIALDAKRMAGLERRLQANTGLAVGVGRLIPGGRTVTSVVSGIFQVSYPSFLVFTMTSTVVWAGALLWLGTVLGENWGRLEGYLVDHTIVAILVLALVVLMGGFLVVRRRRKKDPVA